MFTPSDAQLTVIFNGDSALDSVIRRRIGRRDQSARVAWVPCQATEPDERGGRLCERTLVAITPAGDVDTGWRALGRTLTAVAGSPWPFRIATAPVICPLLSMAFSLTARSLRRLPGVTPWCREHPETCRPRG